MKYVENAACVCCFFFSRWHIKPYPMADNQTIYSRLCCGFRLSLHEYGRLIFKDRDLGREGWGSGGGGDWGAEMSDTQEEWKNNLSPKLKPCDPRAGMKVWLLCSLQKKEKHQHNQQNEANECDCSRRALDWVTSACVVLNQCELAVSRSHMYSKTYNLTAWFNHASQSLLGLSERRGANKGILAQSYWRGFQ